jgi:branched-chain amino acid aminotransferase
MTSRTPERQNGSIWIDTSLSSWDKATVPVMSDAVLRALSVFDGLIAVEHEGKAALVAAQAHARRLLRSARVVDLDHTFSASEILRACQSVANAELDSTGAGVVYVRPMLIGAPMSSRSSGTSLVVTAFAQPTYFAEPKLTRLQTSALRRPPGDAISPAVKATANYHLTRLVRSQAAKAGFEDALLLNSTGRVAEAAGSAILVELDGVLCTPPTSEDCLPSITIDLLAQVADEIDVPFRRQPIGLAEAHGADALALAGTLTPLTPVSNLDHISYGPGTSMRRIRDAYLTALQARTDWRDAGQLTEAN